MVKHIVVFKFDGEPEARIELARKFRDALMALPAEIACLESMEVGFNENPAESCDVVLTAVVPTLEDVDVYAKHPAHVAAASIVKGKVAVRSCVDYTF